MLNATLSSAKPFVRYSRYVTSHDFTKFNSMICAFDNRLFYCKRGRGKIVINEREYCVSHGVLAVIPSGVGYLYSPDSDDPMELLALNFDYDSLSSHITLPIPPVRTENFNKANILSPTTFSDAAVLNEPLVLDKMNAVESDLERINLEYSNKEFLFELRCSSLLHLVLTRIILRSEHENSDKSEILAERIIEYIRESYSDNVTLEGLGEVFGYHPNYLNFVFSHHTGKPIYSYLLDFRIDVAINLLENTTKSVSQISAEVGFCDISHFSKTFKKKTGHTPSDFRIV